MMLGARTGAWSGKALPYDAEVEYLETTGKEYVDTGLLADNEYDVKLKIRTPNILNHTENGIWGCYVGIGGKLCYLAYITFADTRFYGGWDGETYGSIKMEDGYLDRDFEFTQNKKGVTINGVKVITTNTTVINESGLTLWFGASNGNERTFLGKLYFMSIEKFGDKVIDLIPVRKDGVGYMYDRVSGELFGNAGTGSFIVGPDKTT